MKEIIRQLQAQEKSIKDQYSTYRDGYYKTVPGCNCNDPYCAGHEEGQRHVPGEWSYDIPGYLLAVERMMKDFSTAHASESHSLPCFAMLLASITAVNQRLQESNKLERRYSTYKRELQQLESATFSSLRYGSQMATLRARMSSIYAEINGITRGADSDRIYHESSEFFTTTLTKVAGR